MKNALCEYLNALYSSGQMTLHQVALQLCLAGWTLNVLEDEEAKRMICA